MNGILMIKNIYKIHNYTPEKRLINRLSLMNKYPIRFSKVWLLFHPTTKNIYCVVGFNHNYYKVIMPVPPKSIYDE